MRHRRGLTPVSGFLCGTAPWPQDNFQVISTAFVTPGKSLPVLPLLCPLGSRLTPIVEDPWEQGPRETTGCNDGWALSQALDFRSSGQQMRLISFIKIVLFYFMADDRCSLSQ